MNDKEYIEFLEGKEKTQTETVNFLIKENEKLNNALNGKITAYKCREVDKLQSNWNSLREWLKNKIDNFQDDVSEPILHEQMTMRVIYEYMEILDKMNELEGEDK